jgi:hypothetical protein
MELKLKKKLRIRVTEQQLKIISRNSIIHNRLLQEDGTHLVELTRYNMSKYEDIVNGLIRNKYSQSEEFALINKGIADATNEEYLEYRSYVEQCKNQAREFVAERVSIFGK